MAHRDTRKEAHLPSRPSELQPTEDSETQKFNSAHVQQTRQEYSRLTETEKAKFQDPFIYNDDRNFVRHNSVDKFSPNLVFMTTPNTISTWISRYPVQHCLFTKLVNTATFSFFALLHT